MFTDKARDAREMRGRVTRQRLKDNVRLTTPLDLTARGDAFAVSKQDDL